MGLHIVVAPDSFKGSVAATQAAEAIAQGWRDRRPDDVVTVRPMADGGEGTVDAIAAAHPGARRHELDVLGPQSRPVRAKWVMLGDGTAVTELAQGSGLPLMDRPDPLGAHTHGLGETIRAALDAGAQRILVGLGGSASTDGGTGCLTALGARFLDADGRPLPLGGGGSGRPGRHRSRRPAARSRRRGGLPERCGVTAAGTGRRGGDLRTAEGRRRRCDRPAGTRSAHTWPAVSAASATTPATAPPGAPATGCGWPGARRCSPAPRPSPTRPGWPRNCAGTDLLITGEGRFDATSMEGKVVGYLAEQAHDGRGGPGDRGRAGRRTSAARLPGPGHVGRPGGRPGRRPRRTGAVASRGGCPTGRATEHEVSVMTQSAHPPPPIPSGAGLPWTANPSHRRWLDAECDRLLDFAEASPPSRGWVRLAGRRGPPPARPAGGDLDHLPDDPCLRLCPSDGAAGRGPADRPRCRGAHRAVARRRPRRVVRRNRRGPAGQAGLRSRVRRAGRLERRGGRAAGSR